MYKEWAQAMAIGKRLIVWISVVTAIGITGCARNKDSRSASPATSSPVTADSNAGGIEKVKPAPGTGNEVQHLS